MAILTSVEHAATKQLVAKVWDTCTGFEPVPIHVQCGRSLEENCIPDQDSGSYASLGEVRELAYSTGTVQSQHCVTILSAASLLPCRRSSKNKVQWQTWISYLTIHKNAMTPITAIEELMAGWILLHLHPTGPNIPLLKPMQLKSLVEHIAPFLASWHSGGGSLWVLAYFPFFTSISYYMLTVIKYYIIQYLSAPGTCYLTNQLKQSFTEKSKVTIPIKKRISKLSNFCFRSFKQNFKQNFKRISSGFRDPANRWQPNSILSVMTLS